MNISDIKFCDIANGIGVRTSVFVSGCMKHCPGCFNPETWDFDNGSVFSGDDMKIILDSLDHDYIDGLSVLGGEPLHLKNQLGVLNICKNVKKKYPDKTIWLYSGYYYELLMQSKTVRQILKYVDVLVDGPFIEAKKDISLRFRGSSNQRIIDIKQTQKNGKVTLWEEDKHVRGSPG